MKRPTSMLDGLLSWREAASMLFLFIVLRAFVSYPQTMGLLGLTAAWTIPLGSAALSAVWVWPLVILLKEHPGMDIIQITRKHAGTAASIILAAVAVVYFLGIFATDGREVADTLSLVILPYSAMWTLFLLMTIVAMYTALNGVEVIGRVSMIQACVAAPVVLILALLTTPHWSADYLYPLLGPGGTTLLKTYVIRQATFGEVFALGLIARYMREPADLGKAAFWSIASSAVILSLCVMTTEMVFPIPSLFAIVAPFLRSVRLIFSGRFLQRIDSIFVFAWMAVGVMCLALAAWSAAVTVASALSLKTYKLIIPIIMGIGYAIGILLPDSTTTIVLEWAFIRPYGTLILGLWPILLLTLYRLKRRSGKSGGGRA